MQNQTVILQRQLNKERARISIKLAVFKPDRNAEEGIQIINFAVVFYGFTYAFISEDEWYAEPQ
jgi:hypothetical protein